MSLNDPLAVFYCFNLTGKSELTAYELPMNCLWTAYELPWNCHCSQFFNLGFRYTVVLFGNLLGKVMGSMAFDLLFI